MNHSLMARFPGTHSTIYVPFDLHLKVEAQFIIHFVLNTATLKASLEEKPYFPKHPAPVGCFQSDG